jgi:hypothetical protein
VTYDFEASRPTLTSFLMSDFVGRHFKNLVTQHVMVALDACSSGLAVSKLDSPIDETRLQRFGKLATIEANYKQTARNVLVASTGDRPAVSQAGGIFTKALIEGLQGRADLTGDGVVQFDELALYVNRKVIERARALGVDQQPKSLIADTFGSGMILFPLSVSLLRQ